MSQPRARYFPFLFLGVCAWGGEPSPWMAVPVVLGLGGLGYLLLSRGSEPEGAPDGELADVVRRLREIGRHDLAGELTRGAGEYEALAGWVRAAQARADEERAARAEAEDLRRKADAATDPETAATWRGGAVLAERRAERLRGAGADLDRAAARLAAFEQVVKALRVDLADPQGPPPELDSHAASLTREVDALVRARAEVRALDGPAS